MLTVVLIWLYVIVTTYLVGYGFLMTLVNWRAMHHSNHNRGAKRYDFKFRESYLIAGIVLVTVYAQIISLFTKVGLGANIGLIIVCILIACYYRYELSAELSNTFSRFMAGGSLIIYSAIFLLFAYAAGHGLMHYDSDLYHAQAIHWIEDYGVVKGLGNLHVRFAYNSSSFALSALYSMSFLSGQSFHAMSGFFALLLAWQCVDIRNVIRRKHFVISDFVRLAAIYYLFTIMDELVAPASDYFLSTLVFYIMIHWLDMHVKHEKSYVPYILLSLLAIYAVTIKLSAAPMVLLAIIPIYKLWSGRTREKMKAFWISVAMAFVIVLPFLIRNVIISGWLLYPVMFLNLFGFDWKIPKGVAAYDALEIKTFGRGYNDVSTYAGLKLNQWVPHWFESMSAISKAMIILDIVSIIVFVIYLGYFIYSVVSEKGGAGAGRKGNKVLEISHRRSIRTADFLIVSGTAIGCLVFWFFSAPLIRYGVVYVWLVPAIVLGRMVILGYRKLNDRSKEIILRIAAAVFCVWMIYKMAFIALDDARRFNPAYLIKQQDYGTYEVKEFYLGNEKIFYPAEGDQIGYYPFPAATHDLTGEVELRGESVKDGFISK